MDIAKFDKNFEVTSTVTRDDIEWHNITEEGFKIYGLWEDGLRKNPQQFCRIDPKIAKSVSVGVAALNHNTAGARITFTTDSDVLAIRHTVSQDIKPHCTLASGGFDAYVFREGKWRFLKAFLPPVVGKGELVTYESECNLWSCETREITINFPIYSATKAFEIGLKKGSKITPARPYGNDKPVVFYGSSITQGSCASRAGNTYQNFLLRMLNMDYINLGYAGAAKGEKAMAEYIAELPMSVFVYDYDYNAPTNEHLEESHYPFYKIIRDKNPDMPIICMSRPEGFDRSTQRQKIIRETVERAISEGDKNIVFLNGATLFNGESNDSCTVDGCHPNDLGFFRMAEALRPLIEKHI